MREIESESIRFSQNANACRIKRDWQTSTDSAKSYDLELKKYAHSLLLADGGGDIISLDDKYRGKKRWGGFPGKIPKALI